MELLTTEAVQEAIAELKSDFSMSPTVAGLHNDLTQKREAFKTWYDANKTTDPTVTKMDRAEFDRRDAELIAADTAFREAITPDIKAQKNARYLRLAQAVGAPVKAWSFGNGKEGEIGEGGGFKSLSAALFDHDEFKSFQKSAGASDTRKFNLSGLLDIKTLFTTVAGMTPPADRGSHVVDLPRRKPAVQDLLPTITSSSQFIVWMLQTVWNNAAAAVAEGAAKPESAVRWDEQKDQLLKVATYIPITSEALKFNAQLRNTLDNTLINMVRLAAEQYIVSGTGVAPQIKGFMTRPGLSVYVKAAGDNNADAIYKSMAQVRNDAFAEPEAVIINPANVIPITLLKNANGDYIYGNPASAGPQTVWGKPMLQTKAMDVGNALTGDFTMYSEYYISEEVGVEVGLINDQFIKNARTLLAEIYHALVVTRPSAFSNTQGLA